MDGYKRLIKEVSDFPIKGVNFKDISPLLADQQMFLSVIADMGRLVKNPDYWVGVDSRGYLFASAIAVQFGGGVVCARKEGKTPGEFVSQKYDSESDLLFGIFFDGTHIGNIKLGPLKLEHMSTEVSYFIGEKEFWGKGIASKCIETIVQFAVSELGLKKISSGYYENNIGSAKVLKKCGFVIEGTKVSEIIFENKRINHVLVGYVPK